MVEQWQNGKWQHEWDRVREKNKALYGCLIIAKS